MVLADGGYTDPNYFRVLTRDGDYLQITQIWARHETVNGRLKHFRCLKNTFRHDLFLHPRFFHAVVNVTQLML